MSILDNPISALWIGACIAIAMLVALLWAVFSVNKRVNRERGDFEQLVKRHEELKKRRRANKSRRGR